MSKVYKLINQIKHYEWGSARLIPEFLGIGDDPHASKEALHAEMWMGTHLCPSQAGRNGEFVNLTEIAGELTFLFKLLAVEKPLSIQAHPNRKQAEEGFEREEREGLPVNAPSRNYKDKNHKPEIVCALAPVTLMAGFKFPEKISQAFKELVDAIPLLKETLLPVIKAADAGSLSVFFNMLNGLKKTEKENLGKLINEYDCNKEYGAISGRQWELMKYFASLYPQDPGIIAPLYLNLVTLLPGQAVYIPAGVLHSYIKGFAVELMAASDNVLRAALTPKHKDIGELVKTLNFVPFLPQVITPSSANVFNFYTPCEDFSLSVIRSQGGANFFDAGKQAVCLVTEGEVSAEGEKFKKGESFFIQPRDDNAPLVLSGNYSMFAASSGNTGGK
jgi:mannose-6-phosphate isomerase